MAILGVGFPCIHTAYIGEDSSILGTNEMFGETMWSFSAKSTDEPFLSNLQGAHRISS